MVDPMKPATGLSSPTRRQVLGTAVVFSLLVLVFTVFGVVSSPPDAAVGGTRQANSFLPHLAELGGLGFILGMGLVTVYGKRGLSLVFLMPALITLLDLDHLPAYLGAAQPIRPAHSLLFMIAAVMTIAITIKRLDLGLLTLSATLAHLELDTGLFAPLSPLSFDYVQLDQYRVPLLAFALLSAGFAILILRGNGPRHTRPMEEKAA